MNLPRLDKESSLPADMSIPPVLAEAGQASRIKTCPKSSTTGPFRPTLAPLTSLRFFAAVAVFLSHPWFVPNNSIIQWLNVRIFSEGYSGVTFFFVLSGFILTYNYHDRLATLDRREIKSFFVARFARIYPVHFLTFLISIPLVWDLIIRFPFTSLVKAVLSLLVLQSFIPIYSVYFSYNMPSWSLSDEFFFYALLPFILFALTFWGGKRGMSPILIAAGVWLLAFVLVFLGRNLNGGTASIGHWLFYIFPPFRLVDFFAGVALGLTFLKLSGISLAKRWWTLLEISTVIGILGLVFFSNRVNPVFRYGVYYLPLFSFMIFVFAFHGGRLSDILCLKWLTFLGDASYSFYMFHLLVLRYMVWTDSGKTICQTHPIAASLSAFGATVILSGLCYEFFEKPMRARIKQIL